MRTFGVTLKAGLLGCSIALTAAAADPAAGDGIRRDPKGIKGISPFWEALKKGDDAFVARDVEGAMAAYRDALSKEPQNALGHYRMGEALRSQGNLTEARASFESAKRFASEPTLKGKVLFVLADLSERERNYNEAINGWNAYEAHAKRVPSAKMYLATAADRKKRIEEWKKLENDYAAVKERIKKREQEADAALRK